MHLSKALTEARQERGLSLRDVSKATDLSIATLSKIENRNGEITAKTLNKLQAWLTGGPPARFKPIKCDQDFKYFTGYEKQACDGCAVCDKDGYHGYHLVAERESVFDIAGYKLHSWNFIPDADPDEYNHKILVLMEAI
jgi:transcriptional regulator with XRE-family HTH domain